MKGFDVVKEVLDLMGRYICGACVKKLERIRIPVVYICASRDAKEFRSVGFHLFYVKYSLVVADEDSLDRAWVGVSNSVLETLCGEWYFEVSGTERLVAFSKLVEEINFVKFLFRKKKEWFRWDGEGVYDLILNEFFWSEHGEEFVDLVSEYSLVR